MLIAFETCYFYGKYLVFGAGYNKFDVDMIVKFKKNRFAIVLLILDLKGFSQVKQCNKLVSEGEYHPLSKVVAVNLN